jgi:hypothetical protein
MPLVEVLIPPLTARAIDILLLQTRMPRRYVPKETGNTILSVSKSLHLFIS